MKSNIIENVLNFIFPPVCGICGKLAETYLCKECSMELTKVEVNCLEKYNNKFFDSHFWIFKYEDEIRDKIIDYKFNNKSYLYRTFVEIILNNKRACEYMKSFDYIVPVPIHKKRYKVRGYNQCELIAKGIAGEIGDLYFRNDIIKKVKNIVPQSSLNKDERINNVNGAFEILNVYEIKGKKILLLDDVFTTGSTVNECSKLLLDKGCGGIGVFTVAKD